ncbi:MAG: acyltransferase [Candidatus Zixiibacteriota bacterium]|nr:MAG: acyltransferase [candidate division Zixibacteria bacterium]
MKKLIKWMVYGFFYILTLPCGLISKIAYRKLGLPYPYHFFVEIFSLVPTPFGVIVRACFYNQTLKRSSLDLTILFNSQVTKIDTVIGKNVFIGGYNTVGLASVGDNVVISNHISILSGARQHNFDDVNREIFAGDDTFTRVTIGRNSFIGDNCTVMADVGKYSIIGAGSVVIRDIPDYVVAVGSPAKIVKERPRPESAAG